MAEKNIVILQKCQFKIYEQLVKTWNRRLQERRELLRNEVRTLFRHIIFQGEAWLKHGSTAQHPSSIDIELIMYLASQMYYV